VARRNPRVIITLGATAVNALIGPRLTGKLAGLSTTDWVGEIIPDQELRRWVCPTWHPSYLLHQKRDPVIRSQIKQHIRTAIDLVKVDCQAHDYAQDVDIVLDLAAARSVLRDARRRAITVFDYETTGIKPHRQGHRIVYAAVGDGYRAWAFPFFYDSDFRDDWRRLMTGRSRLVVHNGAFEALWTRVLLGYYPNEFEWDTIIGAHVEYNKKRTNLKYLAYTKFGVAGYDNDVEDYLKATPAEESLYGDNGFNQIDRAPREKMLLYCGLDVVFTGGLYHHQSGAIPRGALPGFKLFMSAGRPLVDATCRGMNLKTSAADEQEKKLTAELQNIEYQLKTSPEMKKWDRAKPFRPSAPADLNHLLYDCLGLKAKKFTDETEVRPSARKGDLEELGMPFVDLVLRWKKFQKVRDTYLLDWKREAVDTVIHAFYNLYSVDTYRSSSSSPNGQNVPKRDPEQARPLRDLIRPRPGHRLIEYDYKGAEVCASVCYNRDPALKRYVEDAATDMHRDQAMELFFRPLAWYTEKGPVAKLERYYAKNGFVFAEFYGDYFGKIAPNIWARLPRETKEHLKAHGVKNVRDFTDHVEDVENDFWSKKFPVFDEWKDKAVKDFQRRGYVDLYTGFRCWGPMERNKIINYPIQGTAFHFLLWTFDGVWREMERRQMNSCLIGQIHDAIVADVNPAEEAWVDRLVYEYGTRKIREHWPWIIVPLSIEKSRSEIDGSWAAMQDCGLLKEAV
jgi:DNA polymerase I-like protein with 3'-5' exonuclease and polymerase domains